MNRKAILIESSNVTGQTDLPGARVDIENWKNFLRSDLGGDWKDSEIVVLRKPYSSDVQKALADSADKYCLVAFSGHGCDGTVVLNDHYSSFPIADLKPKGEKGTLIVDSCRGVEDARDYKFGAIKALANEGRVFATASMGRIVEFHDSSVLLENREAQTYRYRKVWCDALDQSSKGTVEMLACSKGQASGENPASGGYYTSLLMQSADRWSQQITKEKVHGTKKAHDYAASVLPPQQTPEYSPLWLEFPFAVKV